MKLSEKYPKQRGGPLAALSPAAWTAIAGGVSAAGGTYAAIRASKQAQLPKPPQPPSQDTAANAALQQQLQLRRRRGVLANIFAGGSQAGGATGSTGGTGSGTLGG